MRELEQRLEAAAPYYEFPETPDLAGAARARLPERRRRSRARVALAFAVAIAVVGGAVLALSPGARTAVVDLFDRIPGIHVERRVSLPVSRFNGSPYYGMEIDLEEARRRFERPLRFPAGLGDPDRLYVRVDAPGNMITAVFGGGERGAELVFSQWMTGGPDLFFKTIAGNAAAEYTDVGPWAGLWIHGDDHGVWYFPPGSTGSATDEHWVAQGYLAGNVLAWREGNVVYRLEADVTKQRALELARSLEES